MPFTGKEDHSISLAEAVGLTKNYRKSTGAGAFLGGYVSKSGIIKILDQGSCVGLRIYNARSQAGDSNFVLVGVTLDGEDMTDGELAEYVTGCPPFCPTASELTGTA